MTPWMVYILRCADDSFYTGITNDLDKRLADHENGKGAKYTRGRAPLKVIYTETHVDRSKASKREIEIKKLSSSEKETLIKQGH